MNNPPETWQWFGNAGHLCVASDCLFHLTTKVGDYLISTVGDWRPYYCGVRVEEPEEVGRDRLYETMVFKAGKLCDCGCGLPMISGSELLCIPSNTAGEANRAHLETCRKIANGYNLTENE